MAPNISTPPVGDDSLTAASPEPETAMVDIATKAKKKAQAVAHAASDSVDQNRDSAAQGLANAASRIQEGAARLPGGDGVTRLAEAAAKEIDAASQYVRQHTTQQMMADLKRFASRHPGALVLGAALVGVLVGRGFRKR